MATPLEQLEAMRRLEENWDGYGGAAPHPDMIDLAKAFVPLVEAALRRGRSPDAQVLHVSPTRIGGVLLEWDDGQKEHEVEFSPNGAIGFLHLDKKTQAIETREFSPAVLTPDLLAELYSFAA